MTVTAKLTLPATSNATSDQLAAIRLLLAVYIQPTVPQLEFSNGSEVSMNPAMGAGTGTLADQLVHSLKMSAQPSDSFQSSKQLIRLFDHLQESA